MPALPTEKNYADKKCILAIGKTGNGKSSTARFLGAKDAKVGDTSCSETAQVTIWECIDDFVYIDTPGFDDSNEDIADEDTARVILQCMAQANIEKLATILWFVAPDIRATQSFKRQARFIESLAQYHTGNVWDNVIIVFKGHDIPTKERDGPLEAARAAYKDLLQEVNRFEHLGDRLENTQVFEISLFESLSERTRTKRGQESDDDLNADGIFRESEPERIRNEYCRKMAGHEQNPVTLLFKAAQCLNCPERNDPRLVGSNCHGPSIRIHGDRYHNVHPGERIRTHTQSKVSKHPLGLSAYHDGVMESYHLQSNKIHYGAIVGATSVEVPHHAFFRRIVGDTEKRTTPGAYSCCGGAPGSAPCSFSCCSTRSAGCAYRYTCCGSMNPCKRRYECCNGDHASAGCLNVFKCCGEDNDGCVHTFTCCQANDICKSLPECCGDNYQTTSMGCVPVFDCCGEKMEGNQIGCMEVCKECRSYKLETTGCGTYYHHDFGESIPQPYTWNKATK